MIVVVIVGLIQDPRTVLYINISKCHFAYIRFYLMMDNKDFSNMLTQY